MQKQWPEELERETYRLFGLINLHRQNATYRIDWAIKCLELGVETDNVKILAGFNKWANEFEVEAYCNKAFKELGIIPPNAREAYIGYAILLAEEIINGIITPEAGLKAIYQLYVELGYPSEMGEWSAIEDEWYCEQVLGWTKVQREEQIKATAHGLIELYEKPKLMG